MLTEVTREVCKSISLTGGHKSLLTVPCFGEFSISQHPSRQEFEVAGKKATMLPVKLYYK